MTDQFFPNWTGYALGGLGFGVVALLQNYGNSRVSNSKLKKRHLIVTCSAGVNIAVIKYWGKRDEELILPLNSSLSATLDQADMKTVTTVLASKDFEQDEIWLNGKKEDIKNKRYQRVLREMRARAESVVNEETSEVIVSKEEWSQYKVRIVSENNFPTAAGLASSASGFCCLVFTLAKLFRVRGDISPVVRMGSGSACRSLYGGWVKWEMGQLPTGSDSIAVQVASETHWPEMRILVFVVNDAKKETSSTSGMETSVKTSKLLEKRAKDIVPERMKQMERAILEKDYQTFGDLTMRDSDDFHAVCADTNPPIFYLNDISKKIIQIIHSFNKYYGKIMAAYTFDAGPNAVIYLLEENIRPLLSVIMHYFPPTKIPVDSFVKGRSHLSKPSGYVIPEQLLSQINLDIMNDGLKYILETRAGPGPIVLDESQSLVDISTNLPKNLK